MSGNVRPFRWTKKARGAAALLADGQVKDKDIALVAGITERQLYRWKNHPDFAAYIEELIEKAKKAAEEASIANKARRIEDYADLRDRLYSVIRDRAADPSMALVPGGKSGLMLRDVKFVKVYAAPATPQGQASPTRQVVEIETFAVDNPLVKSILAVEEQMARERGEWTEKKELTGANGEPLIKAYLNVDLDAV